MPTLTSRLSRFPRFALVSLLLLGALSLAGCSAVGSLPLGLAGLLAVAAALASSACVPIGPPLIIGNPAPEDLDGDGYGEGEDCDESNPDVNPEAIEICSDEIDNDCDGDVDEFDADCLVDEDEDGVVLAKDCDDNDATVYPGAPELCDGQDNDCDGDPEPPDMCAMLDLDGDGFSVDDGDCDDSDADVYPGAPEHCADGIDGDCDGAEDGVDSDCLDVNYFPEDADGDGYDTTEDCDDNASWIHPGAEEQCDDGVDNDCDEGIDDLDPEGCVILNG